MFTDYAMKTASQMGAYKAIAGMMRDAIRELQAGDEFDREWAEKRLGMLADQLEETEAKYNDVEKEVDTVAA